MTSNSEFTVGDLVRLKSGGPTMTVTCVFKASIIRDEAGDAAAIAYRVKWFDLGANLMESRIPALALIPASKVIEGVTHTSI